MKRFWAPEPCPHRRTNITKHCNAVALRRSSGGQVDEGGKKGEGEEPHTGAIPRVPAAAARADGRRSRKAHVQVCFLMSREGKSVGELSRRDLSAGCVELCGLSVCFVCVALLLCRRFVLVLHCTEFSYRDGWWVLLARPAAVVKETGKSHPTVNVLFTRYLNGLRAVDRSRPAL